MDASSAVDVDALNPSDLGIIHMIGCGGAGMSSVMRFLLDRGAQVSGSEVRDWPALDSLRRAGATICRTHDESNLDGVDTVIYPTGLPADNIEFSEARKRHLTILHRSQGLTAGTNDLQTIMVAGTHGKTTTSTAMKVVLGTAGLNPSWIIGVDHGSSEAGGHFGDGAHVVVEADEADRSFLNYRPYVSIITNIRADHVNNYRDLDELQETFLRFALRTRRDGFTVLSADDERCRELADALRAATRRVFTFGVSDDADLRIAEVASTSESASYNAFLGQRALGRVSIALPGRHIAHNSAAVLLSALRLGIPDEITLEGLRQFSGTRRRFEHTGNRGGVRFFDEYAFHPVSMNAALATLREIASPGRLIVVFEPLRLYRAIRFREEIAKELSAVDHLVVKDVYDPAAGLSERREMGQRLQEAVDLPVDAKHFIADDDQIIRHVHGVAVEGDLVVTMGAHPLSLLNRRLLAE